MNIKTCNQSPEASEVCRQFPWHPVNWTCCDHLCEFGSQKSRQRWHRQRLWKSIHQSQAGWRLSFTLKIDFTWDVGFYMLRRRIGFKTCEGSEFAIMEAMAHFVDDLAVKKKEHVHSKLLNYPRVQDIWWYLWTWDISPQENGPKKHTFFSQPFLRFFRLRSRRRWRSPKMTMKTKASDFIGFGALSTNLTSSDMPWYAW